MQNKKLILITITALIIILAGYLLMRLFFPGEGGFFKDREKQFRDVQYTRSKVDPVTLQKITSEVAENVNKDEVRRMPEFILSLPEQKLVSSSAMQIIAANLGFTNKAIVEGINQEVIWSEGVKSLSVDSQQGIVDFSTAFNLSTEKLPDQIPTEELAKEKFVAFLEKSGLPGTFYDLNKVSYEYLTLSTAGILDRAFSETGPLLRINVPYIVSTAPLILPLETHVIVDGMGEIRSLQLLMVNITQTDRMLTVINWNRAKELFDIGAGIVIETQELENNQIVIDSFYPAYYLNQSTFYAIDQKRILTPVYVFSGEKGKIAVAASEK